MAQVIKFYKTEGRNVVYAQNNRKNHLAVVLENWEGTTEVRQKGKFTFITNRAFNYVPELFNAYDLPYEIVEVSKEQEDTVKRVLNAIGNHKGETLEGEDDHDDNGRPTSEVSTTLCLELDGGIYIEVGVSVSGVVTGDGGDYYNPPSWETEWGDIDMDDLKVWIDEDSDEPTEFNMVQEQAILDAIEGLINLQ